MEIIRMSSSPVKTLAILAACGWMLWKMGDQWFGSPVEPGKVTVLTADNFKEVRRTAGTLIALYMRPG